MFPKSLTSILTSFLMIAVLFTGCIEDLDPADADSETTINSNCDFIASGIYESTENEAFGDMVIYTFQTPRYDEELDKCYVRYTAAQHVDPIEVFGSSEGLPEGVSNESGFYTHHDVVTDELFIYEEQVSGSFSEFEARWCLYCEGEMGVLVDNITTWKILESGNIEVTYDNGKVLKLSECNDCQIDFGKKYYSGFGECKDEHYYSDCSNLEVVNEEPDSISAEEFYASIIGTFLDGDEDTFYSFFEGDNITLWGGGSLAKSEIRSLDNNRCDDSSDEYCFPLGENYTEYTMDDFNQDYNILTSNFSQISDGYCAFVDPELTDEENKEECLEFSESLNWTSTFGEDDYMANIEWKHEDDGSSSKWMWDDITFMVISEVEGNWQISWWLLG